jgi:hypothetical protein
MSKISFVEHRFSEDSLRLLDITDKIMVEYARQGYTLTLRQLYYQMIARDLFPDAWTDPQTKTKNNIRNYKRFGDLVNNGRLSGELDWDFIEDRARETVFPAYWDSGADIVKACAQQFRFDKWAPQPYHIEVMAEKDAVSGILTPVCRRLQVRFTANRGYASSSLFYEISKRLTQAIQDDKQVMILYLGDHDPSGIDMTRDIIDRMGLFTEQAEIEVKRLALNRDQVDLWKPPENPAKESDSRFDSYRRSFGDKSWELDAVEPRELANLIESEVFAVRDVDLWDEQVQKEEEVKKKLYLFAEDFEDDSDSNDEEDDE